MNEDSKEIIENDIDIIDNVNEPIKKKPFYKRIWFRINIGIIIVILIFNYFFTISLVSGSSMNPTYNDGDILLCKRHYDIWRFDVVTIASKKANNILIKRVIGLPGETITYKDNQLYINGEPIIQDELYNFGEVEDLEITLKSNEFFCMGDNRSDSLDSRYFGPFTDKEIFAKVYKTIKKKGGS